MAHDGDKELPGTIAGSRSSLLLTYEHLPMPHCDCPKVLVVDDSPPNILAIKSYARALNLTCDEVSSRMLSSRL